MSKRRYPAVLEFISDGLYGISFPDFPGCVTVAIWNEILDQAKEALQFHIDGMVEDGTPVPEEYNPDTVDDLISGLHGGSCVGVIHIEVDIP